MLEGRNLCLYICCDGAARCSRLILVILAVQVLEITLDALVDLPETVRELVRRKVALLGVDRFELAAVNGHEFPREEVQLLA